MAKLVDRIGLAIGAGEVRAVGMRRGRVVWTDEQPLVDEGAIQETITAVLRGAPLRRWPSVRVTVVVGPSRAQTKSLVGLPATQDTAMLQRILRESPSRFFLGRNSRLVTSGVRRTATGLVMGAAIEAPVLDAVECACRTRRLKLVD